MPPQKSFVSCSTIGSPQMPHLMAPRPGKSGAGLVLYGPRFFFKLALAMWGPVGFFIIPSFCMATRPSRDDKDLRPCIGTGLGRQGFDLLLFSRALGLPRHGTPSACLDLGSSGWVEWWVQETVWLQVSSQYFASPQVL